MFRDDELILGIDYYREVLAAPFTLPGNMLVAARRYQYYRPSFELADGAVTARVRALGVRLLRLLGGRSVENDLQVTVHTGVRYSFDFRHRLQTLDMPGGRSTIHIETLNATRNFTPEMKLVAELQYDNVSHQFGASLRYRWEIRPTTELLVTMGESATIYEGFPEQPLPFAGHRGVGRLGHRFQY